MLDIFFFFLLYCRISKKDTDKENTMLVSFVIMFIRRDQKQRTMARLAEPDKRVSGRA